MKYSEGQLVQLAADLRTSKGRLSESHSELTNYVKQLCSTWESDEAQKAYQDKQHRWDRAHEDLMTTLENIAKVVEDGAINMTTTDKAAAAKWV